MLQEEIKDQNEAVDSRVYEVGYLLVPTIASEDVPGVYGNLKELISSLKGEMISDEMPKHISLAYEMAKTIQNKRYRFNDAYFGWVKFFMNATEVASLKKTLDLDPNIIRFLIVKTVKENTLAVKKFARVDSAKKKTVKKEEGAEEEVNSEEIDKEIDAMVEEA